MLATKILYKSNKIPHRRRPPSQRDRVQLGVNPEVWSQNTIFLNTVSAPNTCAHRTFITTQQRQSLPQSTNWSTLYCRSALNRTIWSPAAGDTVARPFSHVSELHGVSSSRRCRRTCCKDSIPTIRSLCSPSGALECNMLKMTLNGASVPWFLTVFSEVLSWLSVFLRTLLFWMVAICVDYAVHDGFRVAAGDYTGGHRGLCYWNCVVLSENKFILTCDVGRSWIYESLI